MREPHRTQRIQEISVLVEAGRKTERMCKRATKTAHRQLRRDIEGGPEGLQPLQPGQAQVMGRFRIHAQEKGQRCARNGRYRAALHVIAGGNTPGNAATTCARAFPND